MFRIIGHRGVPSAEPENTPRSFRKAVELGCDMVETDLRLCGSGEVVAIHDETVDRTTDGSGFVSDMNLDQIRSLDAGSGERIPTLPEVLGTLAGRCGVNLELKGRGTPSPVIDVLDEFVEGKKMSGEEIIISSFDPTLLMETLEITSEYRIGVLVKNNPFGSEEFADRISAFSVHPQYDFINLEFVESSHELGLEVYPWTVNGTADIEMVMGMGCDGVITDYPERALNIRDR